MYSLSIKSGIKKLLPEMFHLHTRKRITELVVPEGVEVIGKQCFQSFHQLKRIYLPESLIKIEEYAFYDCSNLNEISLPNSLIEIDIGCFMYCNNLKVIRIPNSVIRVGERCFNGCYRLEIVEWSKNCPIVESGTFAFCRNLESIEFPEGVITIRIYSFNSCNNLRICKFPNTLENIELGAFRFCLNEITIIFKDIYDIKFIEKFPDIREYKREGICINKIENMGFFRTKITCEKSSNDYTNIEIFDIGNFRGPLTFATLDGEEYLLFVIENDIRKTLKDVLCLTYEKINLEKEKWDIIHDEEIINQISFYNLLEKHLHMEIDITEPILIYWNY